MIKVSNDMIQAGLNMLSDNQKEGLDREDLIHLFLAMHEMTPYHQKAEKMDGIIKNFEESHETYIKNTNKLIQALLYKKMDRADLIEMCLDMGLCTYCRSLECTCPENW